MKSIRKDLIFNTILPIVIYAAITYFAFTTNAYILLVIVPIMGGILVANLSIWMFTFSTGISYKRTRWKFFASLISLITVVINVFLLYLFFKDAPYLLLLIYPYMGLMAAVKFIHSVFSEKSSRPETTLEDIKIVLIVELWFIILLWTLKFAQIIWNKP